MSLTSLIRAGRGPVWSWFQATLPETRTVSTEANRLLRGGPTDQPCSIPAVPGADYGLVGTAVGYVVSAHLRPDALDRTVATAAANFLDGPMRCRLPVRPTELERMMVARIAALAPWERHLDSSDWSELCCLGAALARFEQYFRAGPRILPYLVAPLRAHGDSLDELARALIDDASLSDLESVGRAAVEDLVDVARARNLQIGPNFAQSLPLGGADADLIYDGVLIDLKSTAQARVVGREELWQLLGYLLADTDDEYEVAHLGFAALRRRRRLTWGSQDLLDALSGGHARSLRELRADFAALLAPLRTAHAATRGASLRALESGR